MRPAVVGAALASVLSFAVAEGIRTVAVAAPPASYLTVVDEQGGNDVPSQNDLRLFARDESDLVKYRLAWNWDSTDDWTGVGATGNACALFDADTDGFVDFALCASVQNPNADPTKVAQVAASPYAFTCDDSRSDRCGLPSPKTI